METIRAEFLSRGYSLEKEYVDGEIWGMSFSGEKYMVIVLFTGHELLVTGILVSDPTRMYTSVGSLFDFEHVMGLIEKSLG